MSPELMLASSAISLALVFYTIGVFAERHADELKKWHLIFFYLGLVCDTTGTTIMSNIAHLDDITGFTVHGFTGGLAILLMLIHAIWATWVVAKGSARTQETFHKFSTGVWLIWLIPYVIGMLIGIPVIHLRTICAVGTAVIVVGALASALFIKDHQLRKLTQQNKN